ncbi:YaeQ family protein [Candidatus Desantisbacteria bacterium]|nr:YaeQ family protein [Candidatus Desantisbacteria bacterium]
MAPKATIYKVTLNISDMDRNYYAQHSLTLAKHPSETDERLMVRLLAFAMYADETLAFGKGISEEDPALWLKNLTGDIDLWIEVGKPDQRVITKACTRAKQVALILYGSSADIWWKNNHESLTHKTNLTVKQLPYATTQAMASMAGCNMDLNCNIEDNQIFLMSDETTLAIDPVILLQPKNKIHQK